MGSISGIAVSGASATSVDISGGGGSVVSEQFRQPWTVVNLVSPDISASVLDSLDDRNLSGESISVTNESCRALTLALLHCSKDFGTD